MKTTGSVSTLRGRFHFLAHGSIEFASDGDRYFRKVGSMTRRRRPGGDDPALPEQSDNDKLGHALEGIGIDRNHTPIGKREAPNALVDHGNGAPDRIRTCDLWLRRPTLYPAELRAQKKKRQELPKNRPSHPPFGSGSFGEDIERYWNFGKVLNGKTLVLYPDAGKSRFEAIRFLRQRILEKSPDRRANHQGRWAMSNEATRRSPLRLLGRSPKKTQVLDQTAFSTRRFGLSAGESHREPGADSYPFSGHTPFTQSKRS